MEIMKKKDDNVDCYTAGDCGPLIVETFDKAGSCSWAENYTYYTHYKFYKGTTILYYTNYTFDKAGSCTWAWADNR